VKGAFVRPDIVRRGKRHVLTTVIVRQESHPDAGARSRLGSVEAPYTD